MEPSAAEQASLVTVDNCADWANLRGDAGDLTTLRGACFEALGGAPAGPSAVARIPRLAHSAAVSRANILVYEVEEGGGRGRLPP